MGKYWKYQAPTGHLREKIGPRGSVYE
jgi:hypothetical protein